MPKKSINILLEELNKTVISNGIENTISILRNARQNFSDNQKIQITCLTICNYFSIDLIKLRTEKTEKAKYAKGFIIHYLRESFKIQWDEIKQLLSYKDKTWLWELKNLIASLNPKLKSDSEWILAKKFFDEKIKEYN